VTLKYVTETENFQRFVVQKLLNLESKWNVIQAKQKLILEKLSNPTFEAKESETIDVFQELPLKDNQDLVTMETRLKNDVFYRNQMVSPMSIF